MTHSFFRAYRFSVNAPMWTLSVEESFYLITPFLLMYLGWLPRVLRWRHPALKLALQGVFLYMVYLLFKSLCWDLVVLKHAQTGVWDHDFWTATLFGRFSDFAWGMVAGLLVRTYLQHGLWNQRWFGTVLFVAGGTLYRALAYWMETQGGVLAAGKSDWFDLVTKGYGLAGALMILASAGRSWVHRVFANRAVVYLGKISFCLYLCQYLEIGSIGKLSTFLMTHTRSWLPWEWLAALGTYGATNLVAAAFYHGVEHPCQRWLCKRFLRTPTGKPPSPHLH